jgi:cobalamin biosynthesis protein CobT
MAIASNAKFVVMQGEGSARPRRTRKLPAHLADSYLSVEQHISQDQDQDLDPSCPDDRDPTSIARKQRPAQTKKDTYKETSSDEEGTESSDEEGATSEGDTSSEGDTPRQLDQGCDEAAKAPRKSLKRLALCCYGCAG